RLRRAPPLVPRHPHRPVRDGVAGGVAGQPGHPGGRPADAARPDGAPQRFLTTSTMSSPAAVGLVPTCTPAARRASIFPCAVPLPPDTMAPAWPIFLPGGAVTPAT